MTKSGKTSYGLGKFFSSIYSRAVSGLGFQCLSLIEVERRISWSILTEQISPSPKKKKPVKTKKKKANRGRGRPKGSKNKNHREVKLSAEMTQVKAMLERIGTTLTPIYFVYDGVFWKQCSCLNDTTVWITSYLKITQQFSVTFPIGWRLFR